MRRPLLFLCVCLFVLIAFVMQVTSPPPWNSEAAVSQGEEVFIVGQVYKKEYKKTFDEETILFYLNVINYSKEAEASYHEIYQKLNNETSQNSIKIICEMNIAELPCREDGSLFLPYLGERVLLQGQWQEFAHATNPGEFDYADYYSIEGIAGKLRGLQLLASDQNQWPVRELLFGIRQRWLQNLYNTFVPKDAAILAKMLLGDGSGLDKEVRDLYQNNGIVHILSISGLHISLIGMGMYKLLRRCGCPIRIAAVFGGTLIVMYGMMTGFGVSACRAIGMYLIRMLGEIWGKTYDMLTAMGVLAIFLLLQNPRLVYHSGYLLSFASVCGLGLLVPILPGVPSCLMGRPYDKAYRKWLKRRGAQVWSSLMVSLSVTLFTLPVQLFFFYKIPMYSVLINLLVIPFMGVVMLIGFGGMLLPILTFLCPIEGMLFSWFEWLCCIFQRLPGHTWVTGRPDMWKIVLYYVVILGVVCLGKRLKKPILLVILTGLVLFVGIRIGRETKITFLDVGQGDCICLQTASGECYLFDGGSSTRTSVGEKVIIPFLQYCGISKVTGVLISHPDIDHTNGVEELLQSDEIVVERLILPQVADAKEEFEKLLLAAGEDTAVEFVAKGAVMANAEYRLTCLHPPTNYEAESNTYSACYLLELEDACMLFTGDVEDAGEIALTQELVQRRIDNIDILKVAHHGSRYSTAQEFLNAVDIKLAVVSCSRSNSYGHPHKETIARLKEDGSVILTTPECGAVIVEVKEGIRVNIKWKNQ